MSSEPFDTRALLLLGDRLLREGRYAEAIAAYHPVASYYLDQGFALRAVAVLKQIVQIANRDPGLAVHAAPALRMLVAGYRALGLEGEALTAEARLHEYEPPF
jgi:tetratricopeptide (TPR) repeat protein